MDKYVLDGQYGKYLEMVGIRVGEALKTAGVPEDLFSHKKPILDEADYYRFMDAVGNQVKDPTIPIAIASADNIESFSPPIFAAYCSKNTKVCCERRGMYKRIIAPMRYEISENADEFRITIATSSDSLEMPWFLVETEMVFLINIIRKATKENIIPAKIFMKHSIEAVAFRDYMGCDITPSAENAISLRSEDAKKPFISSNEGMWDFFEPELRKRLYEMEKDDSFSARVRSALTELLPGGAGTADEVAAKLGVSKRTLQRKLMEEDTSFQKQLNGTRELLAKNYICNTEMSSEDIAFLLGYRELNSFLRAFSMWTGMSISEYRKNKFERNA